MIVSMSSETPASGSAETKDRILEVALEVLGKTPSAGMGEVAAAAGVVRRTVYGYFPTRSDLVLGLTRRAARDMEAVLAHSIEAAKDADAVWADFIIRLWPLVNRYRVLVSLRRGDLGHEIHAALVPVDEALAAVVRQGQDSGAFTRHLPADVLSQVAWATVFNIADSSTTREELGAPEAAMTSLLILGVPESRARALLG